MTNKAVEPVRLVRCPRCRKSVRYDETNEYRPFCSPVCKNEDIIGWAQESFRIAGPAISEDDADALIEAAEREAREQETRERDKD